MTLAIVTVPAEELARLIDNAVARALAAHRLEERRDEQIVSLDGAARLLRRRRAVVLDMVRAGKLPAKCEGTEAKPLWRIRVADLRRVTP